MAILSQTMDEFFSKMPTGTLERAIGMNLRGIDQLQAPGAIPINKDMPGFTFFTRPQLNMQSDNLRNVRQFANLLSRQPVSMQSYIRCMLDPRLQEGISYKGADGRTRPLETLQCPFVDPYNAFIPPLTNNLISISGWPSISAPVNTSTPGLYNESQTMVDGRVINSEAFDITANFRNTRGDVILYMFYTWALYMSMTFEGRLIPYLDFITENEFDCNTRIYRIVTDYTKTRVTKIACTLASLPVGIPTGDAFDIPGDKPYVEANREISMRFACTGVRYFDDLVAYEFNQTVQIFNPSMADSVRPYAMTKVPLKNNRFFKNLCYPHINLDTAELEWWVMNDIASRITQRYIDSLPETNSEEFEGD